MFDVIDQTPKDIIIIYIMFMGACLVTYPIMNLVISAAEKGLEKWK